MESLKINIPKGFRVGDFNKVTGEVTFEPLPKSVQERIKSFADVLEHHDIDEDDFNDRIEDMTDDEAAYVKIKMIVETLNEGWKPNWSDSNERKYYPWFEMNGSSGFRYCDFVNWFSLSHVGSRLCFKSRELAEYAGKQFTDIYKEYMLIN